MNLIQIFNNFILFIFRLIYKYCKIETIEDKYHKEKKNNNKIMNKIKFKFNKECDFNEVKNNIINIIQDNTFLKKYNITTDSILNNNNNKLIVFFDNLNINISFNHYYISGSNMFIILNKIVNSTPPVFLKTNPFLGIIYLPFYIFDLMSLKKKEYVKNENKKTDLIIEKNIVTNNKRFYLYSSIFNKIYKCLKLNRPMVVGLSIAFEDVPYINNNVGLIIITYEINDTIEILEKKIKNSYYQAYVSNFILNCPLPFNNSFEIRDYIDCIVSCMYVRSDLDFIFGWNTAVNPTEQIYVGSSSIIHSDNTMDINMIFNSCSLNYHNVFDPIEKFIED